MAIVTSAIVEDARQVDGRRWIAERHVDQIGREYDFRYLAAADFDAAAGLVVRAAAIDAELTAAEIASNLDQVRQFGPDAALSFDYSSQAQSVMAMAQQANTLSSWQVVLLGRFLASREPATLTELVGMSADQIAIVQAATGSVASALATLQQIIAGVATIAAQQGG